MTKKKVDLKKEAQVTSNDAEFEPEVTEELLKELCPKEMLAQFKKAKSAAQRADFLYEYDKGVMKEARDTFKKYEDFEKKLKRWFIQEFENDQKGVTGKIARVEIKKKTVPSVTDWDKFYKYIKKNEAFDLLNRAVNAKGIQERWDAKKQVAGVEPFERPSVSLTKANG